jgi:C1A family cysteine protease
LVTLDITSVRSAILQQKVQWTAADAPFATMDLEELKLRLGVIVDEKDLARINAQPQPDMAKVIGEFEARLNISVSTTEAAAAPTTAVQTTAVKQRLTQLPTPIPIHWPPWLQVVDWRNRKGRNNVTPVTDQGGCGSCVAFGTIGTLESMVLIEHVVSLDLSEAELLFCGGGSCGGWWPSSAVTYLSAHGVAQESCFPYVAHNVPCHTCAERDGEAIQITSNVTVSNMNDRKHYLAYVGPMMCVFAVYNDFFSYGSGVYKHVTGGLAGYHCVEVIGYDDFQGCWICKNSWGPGWGDHGFFKIAYGQCFIDTTNPFWGISGTRWH